MLAVSGGDDLYFRPIYNNLLTRDKDDQVDLDHSLAEAFEIVDDTTIVYKLRKGVQFHDGNDFTSEDVVWNFNYLMDPDVASVSRQSYLIIDSIDAPGRFHGNPQPVEALRRPDWAARRPRGPDAVTEGEGATRLRVRLAAGWHRRVRLR